MLTTLDEHYSLVKHFTQIFEAESHLWPLGQAVQVPMIEFHMGESGGHIASFYLPVLDLQIFRRLS